MKLVSSNNLHKLLLLIILFFLVIVSFNKTMGEDEGRFSYMGRVWVENDLPPYTGSIENKTPGIFILNAISYALFGTNVFFMRTIGIISLLLASLIIYKIGTQLHSYRAGVFAMTVFGLTMSWRMMDGAFASLTESFMILFTVLSFYIIIKKKTSINWRYWTFAAGLSMGLAIAFKQIALTSTIALIFYYIINNHKNGKIRDSIIGLILICFGILTSTIISIVPLWISNVQIIDYINGAWLLLSDEGSTPSFLYRFISARELWMESRMNFFYPFLILLVFQQNLLKKKYFLGLFVWLIFDFIGVNSSGYYFGHQIKQLIPSLSIIIGILLGNLIEVYIKNVYEQSKYTRGILIFLLIFMLPYNLMIDDYIRIHHKNYIEPSKEIGLFIKENTNPDDFVFFMTNANAILSYTERVSSSRYFNPLFINDPTEYSEVYFDLITKPPKYIIRGKINIWDFTNQIEDYVNQNYVLYAQIYDFLIYKKN